MENAAIVATKTYKIVDVIVTNRLLKTYRESGIFRFDKRPGKALKFCNVGLRTKNLGGKIISSSNGLNEVTILYISGKTENNPKTTRNKT